MPVAIPDVNSHSTLRNVLINGHRLHTWETNRRYQTGQWIIGYAFYLPGQDSPLFVGEDCGVAPSDAIDSDAALVSVLGWLTLKPGDTDSDYFAAYSPEQLAWCESNEAEEISLIVFDVESWDESESHLTSDDGTLRYAGSGAPVFPDALEAIAAQVRWEI
jgi:hypothetical protein